MFNPDNYPPIMHPGRQQHLGLPAKHGSLVLQQVEIRVGVPDQNQKLLATRYFCHSTLESAQGVP